MIRDKDDNGKYFNPEPIILQRGDSVIIEVTKNLSYYVKAE